MGSFERDVWIIHPYHIQGWEYHIHIKVGLKHCDLNHQYLVYHNLVVVFNVARGMFIHIVVNKKNIILKHKFLFNSIKIKIKHTHTHIYIQFF